MNKLLKILFLFPLLFLVSGFCFAENKEVKPIKQTLLNQAKNGSDDAKKILDVETELKAYSEAKLGKGWWKNLDDVLTSVKKLVGKESSVNIVWKNLDDKNIR